MNRRTFVKSLGLGAAGVLVSPARSNATPYVPALLSGQSNAVNLSPHLPAGSHVLVGRAGAGIASWDFTDPYADLGQQFQAALAAYDFGCVVWWQGESDAAMPPSEYNSRLYTLLAAANRPVMIVEIATGPGRDAITAVHRQFAADPTFGQYVAFIPTADLPRDGATDHFTPLAYDVVATRLVTCYQVNCFATM